MLMHNKKLTLVYTCFCTPRSQLSNCLQKPWRECSVSMGAQLSFGSAFAAGAAWKQDAKIRTGAQEGTSKGCFLEAVGKVRICLYKLYMRASDWLSIGWGLKPQLRRFFIPNLAFAGRCSLEDAKIQTGAQEGTSKGCFLETVVKYANMYQYKL